MERAGCVPLCDQRLVALEALARGPGFGWHVRQSPEREGRANCMGSKCKRAVVVQDGGERHEFPLHPVKARSSQ